MKSTFKFKTNWTQPIEETEYFLWLKDNQTDNGIENKKGFLKSIGFEISKQKISAKDLDFLNLVENHFYFLFFKIPR